MNLLSPLFEIEALIEGEKLPGGRTRRKLRAGWFCSGHSHPLLFQHRLLIRTPYIRFGSVVLMRPELSFSFDNLYEKAYLKYRLAGNKNGHTVYNYFATVPTDALSNEVIFSIQLIEAESAWLNYVPNPSDTHTTCVSIEAPPEPRKSKLLERLINGEVGTAADDQNN